ncbi:MAG: DUF4446 family protein [Candidatus Nanopelagicales bacterium]
MPPVVSASLAVLALVLAGMALVLATMANRRWVAAGGSRQNRDALPSSGGSEPAAAVPEVIDLSAAAGPPAAPAHGLAAMVARVEAVNAHTEALDAQVEGLTAQVEGLSAQARASAQADAERAATAPSDPTALRHIALVRYDAFADVGGRLSYSVALLDDTRSGLVLTTLAGKADVRTYVRTLSAGRADGTLTAEEQQAIEAAVGRL